MGDLETAELPWVTVFEEIREAIETERWEAGFKLPSVRELMALHDVSSQTVQRAVRELNDAGLVQTVPARGTFVRQLPLAVERSSSFTQTPEAGAAVPYTGKTTLLRRGEVVAPPYAARLLSLDRGASVVERARLMLEEGRPVELVTSFYPLAVASGTELESAARLKGGSPAALERLGHRCARTTEWVHARLPFRSEIPQLAVSSKQPVFRILRVVFDEEQVPVEAIEMVMSAERRALRYDM